MAYIGPAPKLGQNREVDDISSGFNGSTTAFTLQVGGSNVSPGSANSIIVSVNNVIQNPNTDYTINGSTITFTSAPTNGQAFFAVVLNQGVDTSSPADGSVTTAKLGDDSVTAAKLANTSVTAGSYTTADLTVDAQGRITAASNGNISSAEIADNAVTTAKIADDAVTSAKIADGAVVNARLGNDSVTSAKIDAGAVDATALASNAVTTAKINAGAVTNAKLGDDSITAAKIDDGAVGTAALATDAVTQAKIADGAIDSARLAASAVTTGKINDQAVTAAKIADTTITSGQLAAGAVTASKLASGVGGKVLQVVSQVKTDTATQSVGSTNTWDYDNSSLRVAITGASTNNKFLFIGQVTVAGARIHVALKDNSNSQVVTGMVATGHGSRRQATTGASGGSNDTHSSATVPIIGLISVPDTSEHQYYFQFSHTSGSTRTLRINETESTTDNIERGRYISSLTVMEIAG